MSGAGGAAGAAVDHVASGTEADAALMTNNEFDLLILDLGLPKMHGLEVLRKLRARGATMPVLILTAADAVEERVKGLDLGADDYMAKPFSAREMVARIKSVMRRARSLPENLQPEPVESFRFAGWTLDLVASSMDPVRTDRGRLV